MSLTAKYNHAFDADVALTSVSSTATKGRIMPISPVQTFGGAEIIDSVKPFSKTGVYIKGELAGEAKAAGTGTLTVEIYSADSASETPALCASFGPFSVADINAGEFLNAPLPENAKGVIQIGVKGANLTAGAVRIRVEA